jgi:hypothetical protein
VLVHHPVNHTIHQMVWPGYWPGEGGGLGREGWDSKENALVTPVWILYYYLYIFYLFIIILFGFRDHLINVGG